MGNDDEQPSIIDLKLTHRKLNGTLSEQTSHSEHIDEKAMGLLRISFAFTSVTAAVLYYIARQQNESTLGSMDNPFTYVALLFGGMSLFLSFLTLIHTKIETELSAPDIRRHAKFGRKEFLVTLNQVYPIYIKRNKESLKKDINFLTVAQVSLILSVIAIVVSTMLYINGKSIEFYGILAVTFAAGGVFSILVVWIIISLLLWTTGT